MLNIKDKPGCVAVETMRQLFETVVRDTPPLLPIRRSAP